jgi:hypothetical protein
MPILVLFDVQIIFLSNLRVCTRAWPPGKPLLTTVSIGSRVTVSIALVYVLTMLRRLIPIATLVMQMPAHAQPPQILFIAREYWLPGHEADLTRIETHAAKVCIGMGVPHPYLGIESVTGPKEVWYINGLTSNEEFREVNEAYSKNRELTAAMARFARERAAFESQPARQGAALYRADLSLGVEWQMGMDRYLVILVTKNAAAGNGAVFVNEEDEQFVVSSAKTLASAKQVQSVAGPKAKIFVVRPEFSMPAAEWVANEPAFWTPKHQTQD